LFDGTIVEPTLKHCLSVSIGLAVIASAAMYVLAYFLFTIHEEIGISADAALPLAIWSFPIVFLGSLVGGLVRKARPGRR
jgi:hypothetical protein